MSSKQLSDLERQGLNAAIAADNQPRAPNGARGLILTIPGARHRTLVDVKGKTTKFGAYYWSKAGAPAPNRGFDYAQVPVRAGRRETIQLLDGSTATARTWNPRTKAYSFTTTGKEFYKHHTDRWLVQIPSKVYLRRKDNSYYVREEYMPSSANNIGELHMPATMSEADQKQKVRAISLRSRRRTVQTARAVRRASKTRVHS